MTDRIEPLGSRIVATRENANDTVRGIIVPASVAPPAIATVDAVGPAVQTLVVGDRILFKEGAISPFTIGDMTFFVIEEKDVLAKVV